MGPDAPGGGLAGLGSGAGAVVSTEIPSNRGSGPAIIGWQSVKGFWTMTKHRVSPKETHAAKLAQRIVYVQLEHVQSIEEQLQIQPG
jgi:hypothetical protein